MHSLVCCDGVPMLILLQYRNAEAALWALHKQRKIPCSGEHAQGVVNSTENDEEGIHPPSSEDFLAASSKLVKVCLYGITYPPNDVPHNYYCCC